MATLTFYIHLLLACVLSIPNVNADTCNQIEACVKHLHRFDTIFFLLASSDDVMRLCRSHTGPRAVDCMELAGLSHCHSETSLNEASLVKTVISIVCSSDPEVNTPGLLSSECAVDFSLQEDFFKNVYRQCNAIYRRTAVSDAEKCSVASELRQCLGEEVMAACGAEFKAFYDRLWQEAPADCGGQIDRAYQIYTSYTPVLM